MIIFKNVNHKYSSGIIGLDNVNLRVARGDFVFVVGTTGGGKSTLLKVIYAEEKIDSGQILVLRGDISDLSPRTVPLVRRNIGVVFQSYELLSNRTVEENVAFTLEVIGVPKYEVVRKVPAILRLVGLEGKGKSYPDELSGGEQQRVSIARAIINNPPILLADEPTGNLDPDTSVGIVKLLMKINENGTTVLMATHDKTIVDTFAKRVLLIENGKILADIPKGGYADAIKCSKVFHQRNASQY